MAAASNQKNYSVDTVVLTSYPTGVQVQDNLISKSWNDMNGRFHDIPVNLKSKIIWKFDVISDNDIASIYGPIREKILTTKSRFFEINTKFPGGYLKGTYYLGATVSFDSVDWMSDVGDINYWKTELHWIEVDGIPLNSPLVTGINILTNKGMVEIQSDDTVIKGLKI